MNKLQEVKIVKNEIIDSTSTYRLEVLNEIKTEPHEDENKFSEITDTSFEMCPIYNVKLEKDESVQELADVGSQIKDEASFLNEFNHDESNNKTESDEEEKFWKNVENGSNRSGTNQVQDLLSSPDTNNRYKKQKYVCSECKKSFKMRTSLTAHLRSHTGEKPFTCHVCMKSFSQKGNLDTHLLIHSGVKQFVCDVCERSFRQKADLHRHRTIHIGLKSFPCSECCKAFARKDHLVLHERIHTGYKPYVCEVCNKAFTGQSNLDRHRRSHM